MLKSPSYFRLNYLINNRVIYYELIREHAQSAHFGSPPSSESGDVETDQEHIIIEDTSCLNRDSGLESAIDE